MLLCGGAVVRRIFPYALGLPVLAQLGEGRRDQRWCVGRHGLPLGSRGV